MFRRFLPELRNRPLETRKPTGFAELMEEFWRDPFGTFLGRQDMFPALDMSEDDKQVVVTAELPGMDPKDVDISIDKGVLTLKGEKKFEEEEKKENYHRIERSYGSFRRSVSLPTEVAEDKVKARFKDGVLKITLPKSEQTAAKKIQIES